MHLKTSFDALRLCALVAAGVTSGYLWRAAFESSSPQDVRLAGIPRILERAPAPPVVRISPAQLARLSRPSPTLDVTSNVDRPVWQVRQAPTTPSSPSVTSAAEGTPGSTPRTGSRPTSRPTPSSRAAHQPTAPPAPQPATVPTTRPAVQPAAAAVVPPTTTRVLAMPPVATTTTTTTTQPALATTPITTPTASPDESRPGWGKGDENHDHTGPGKKKP
jgi:hypothetical protein